MIKIVLASRNKKKIHELKGLIKASLNTEVDVLSLDDIGFYGEIEENGKTFEENAIAKASVPAKYGYIGVADDSGLCVDALGGEPVFILHVIQAVMMRITMISFSKNLKTKQTEALNTYAQ